MSIYIRYMLIGQWIWNYDIFWTDPNVATRNTDVFAQDNGVAGGTSLDRLPLSRLLKTTPG